MKRSFFIKIFHHLFAAEQLILFRFVSSIPQKSPAEVCSATFENIQDVLFFDTPDKVEKYRNFLFRGDKGYLAYLDGKCVHRSWVITLPRKVWLHWSLPFATQENEAYIHFCETATLARGKNIFSHVLCRIAADYRHCKNIYICVNVKNRPSSRSIEKAGFMPVKRYRIIAFLNMLVFKKEYE